MMFLIHGGIYNWMEKRIAFRNDYCLSCDTQRKAVQIRTFDMVHIFWIPLIPLGFYKRWYCMTCSKPPMYNTKTRRSYKILGIIILVMISLSFWYASIEPGDELLFWGFRIGAPLALALSIGNLLQSKPEPTYKARFSSVPLADDCSCPFCHVPLVARPEMLCPICGVKRL